MTKPPPLRPVVRGREGGEAPPRCEPGAALLASSATNSLILLAVPRLLIPGGLLPSGLVQVTMLWLPGTEICFGSSARIVLSLPRIETVLQFCSVSLFSFPLTVALPPSQFRVPVVWLPLIITSLGAAEG